MSFKIKAGKFDFDKETKKVKVNKDQGMIHVIRNQEDQTHFKWINLAKNYQELDIIVFTGDAIFQKVNEKKNTFVLRFGMDDDRYFYWLQEKTDEQKFVTEINKVINAEAPQQGGGQMVDEKDEQPKIDEQSKPSAPVQQQQASKLPQNIADMIKNLGKQLKSQSNKSHHKQTAITHLYDVMTPEVIKNVLSKFTEEDKEQLLQFMPEEQKDVKYIQSNIRSPQFMQALDALSDALNSENSFPIFAQMKLNDTHLNNYYGVQAFLRALLEKAKADKPKQQQQEK